MPALLIDNQNQKAHGSCDYENTHFNSALNSYDLIKLQTGTNIILAKKTRIVFVDDMSESQDMR